MTAQPNGEPTEKVTVLPALTGRQRENFDSFLNSDLQKNTGISGFEEFPDLTARFVAKPGTIRLNCAGGIIDLVIPDDISIDTAAWIGRLYPKQSALSSRSIDFEEEVSIVARAIIYLKTNTKVLTCTRHDPRVPEMAGREVVEPAQISISEILLKLYMFASTQKIPSLANNIKHYWLHLVRNRLNSAAPSRSIGDRALSEMVASLRRIIPANDQLRKDTRHCFPKKLIKNREG